MSDQLTQVLGSLGLNASSAPSFIQMQKYGASLLAAFGSGLSERQQIWLTAHLSELPEFLYSDEGGYAVGTLLEEFKKFLASRVK